MVSLFRLIPTAYTKVKIPIAWLFASALLPGVIALSVFLHELYQAERFQLEQGALQTARALAHAIDRDIAAIKGKLQILATSPSLARGDLTAFRDQAKQALGNETLASAIVLINPDGQQVMNTLAPRGADLPHTGHPEMLQQTLSTAQPTVSDLYVGGVARRYFVTAEIPVIIDGKVAYALDMGMPPERLSQILLTQQLPAGWVASLLDRRGKVIARTQNQAMFVGKQATGDLLQKMQESNEGSLASHTLEGTTSFVAFSRSSMSGWTIAVAMSREVLYKNLYRPLIFAVIAMLAFIFSGIALAFLFSRYIRQALLALEEVTQAAAAGDLTVMAPTSGPREIAQLAEQFNHMQIARIKAEEEIKHLAYYDPLTQLPNRRLLTEWITQSLARTARSKTILAVCYLDLDGFKPVNDTYGHDCGDLVLIEIARRLKNAIRSIDIVSRLGGDEFVLLLTDLKSADECHALLERILTALGEPIPLHNGQQIQISTCIGVTFYPGDSDNPETLLRHSDQAMYKAKQAGGNRIAYFDQAKDI